MTIKFGLKNLKYDCRNFKGDIPCAPHKRYGVHCIGRDGKDCRYFDPVKTRILIIKLGAIGDVIRTTPLLRKLKDVSPGSAIWWLTLTPEIIPGIVDVILPFTPQSLAILQATSFDALYNLDKDREACALSVIIEAKAKKGFTLKNGKCVPLDSRAGHKYLTGIFDDLSRANKKSYQEEIFEICGFTFAREEYLMPEINEYKWILPQGEKIVGLNTGCGGRWTSRLWPERYWVLLVKRLRKAGFTPLLLGGQQEHKKNIGIARRSGALYFGHFQLDRFMSEVDQCDLVVTAVTMGMHIAIGLKKKIVLFNNIFNKDEFELYGRGEIIEPAFECDCFYSPVCANNCMKYISVETVFDSCVRLLGKGKK